jgi:hypothetical protein
VRSLCLFSAKGRGRRIIEEEICNAKDDVTIKFQGSLRTTLNFVLCYKEKLLYHDPPESPFPSNETL